MIEKQEQPEPWIILGEEIIPTSSSTFIRKYWVHGHHPCFGIPIDGQSGPETVITEFHVIPIGILNVRE